MPRKAKARLGYGLQPLMLDGRQHFFERAFIQTLIEKFPPRGKFSHEELTQRLDLAAQIFFFHKNNQDDRPRQSESIAALKNIISLSDRLHMAVTQLDEITGHLFWRPEMRIEHSIFRSAEGASDVKSAYGHNIQHIVIDDNRRYVGRLGPNDLVEALTILGNYGRAALVAMPENKGGRASSHALRMWLYNLEGIWTGIFGRAFTLDYQAGEPVSAAARFCQMATKPLIPKLPRARIISGMKSIIAENRKRGAGKNPTQNRG